MRLPLAALALFTSAAAQTSLKPHPSEPRPVQSALPITRVALYKNGVGFFEHAGRVSGDQSVTIDFTSAQLNDVLQSLTAIDLNGGRISGAGYNSTTPLDQQLKTLPLALSDNPSDVDFYTAIRGARVQVMAPGVSIAGRLLSIDLRAEPAKSGEAADAQAMRRFITVVSDGGQVRTLELTAATTVTLLDNALHGDVTRYLELISSARNQGLRHLTLLDRGTGQRDLRVSYISEVPVWKSTYRILFTDAKTPAATATVQGWSVVDNTTGSDWSNVHLDLIAGAPQSFIQPLSIPYYSRRPEIPLPSEAQLAPQTHESGDPAVVKEDGPAQQAQVYVDGFAGGQLPKAKAEGRMRNGVAGLSAGVAVGVMGGKGSAPAAAPMLMAGRNADALSENAEYQALAASSLAPATTTAAFDDFFEYSLTDPITIRKNESALVPILQTKLPIERVTLWSPQHRVPLRSLWVTNSSNLTLDRGSFSIVENGNFGGEGLLDAIHPNEKRLLSYAADQAVHVDTRNLEVRHRLRLVTISKGILTEHYRDVDVHTYVIRNAAPEPRTVVIEHPRTNSFELRAAADLPKPDETLPNAYRFRLVVAPGKSETLHIEEQHAYPRTLQVGTINDAQIKLLLQDMGSSADEKSLRIQLQPVLDAQAHLADLNAQRRSVDDHLDRLRKEEERQRSNIVALKDSDKVSQKRFVDELGRIEDQILDLQKQQQTLDAEVDTARGELATKVQQIQFTQTLEP